MKSITVIVITYNQENVIARCLNSVLSQKQYGLKSIIVCDDCSKDGTWDIINNYKLQFPSIIKPYRNEHNIGIYPNLMKGISLRGVADLYYELSGDDVLCDGWFKNVQKIIDQEQIDFTRPIGIYSDWKTVSPDGKESIIKQGLIEKYNLFSLYIRGIASSRSLLVNNEVVKKYGDLIEGKGLNLTEAYFDSQKHRYIEKAYYLPYVGTVYYTGVGISEQLIITKSDYWTTQNIKKWQYFLNHLIKNDEDRYVAFYNIAWSMFMMKPSFGLFFKVLWYYQKGRMLKNGKIIDEYYNLVLPMIKWSVWLMIKK